MGAKDKYSCPCLRRYTPAVSSPRNELERRNLVGTARYLTFSCYRRLRLFENDLIKDAFVVALSAAADRHAAAVLAWVVMPEHVHLIVYFASPDAGPDHVPVFLRSLKQPFARTVLNRWRTLNAPVLRRLHDRSGTARFWQPGGGYDLNVIGEELVEKIRYVHANPIRRGLSPDSVGWCWSSARAYRSRPDAIGPPIAFDLVPNHKGELT